MTDKKDITKYISYFTVIITGARPGEILIGTSKTSHDAVFRLTKGIIPPSQESLDEIREYPDLWKMFINKLGSIEFFANLSISQREEWLKNHQVKGDIDISEFENTEGEFLQLGDSTLLTLDENQIDEILTHTLPISTIRNMFKGKPGSEGLKGRHTLIFYRQFWKVSVIFREVKQYSGLILDVENGILINDYDVNSEKNTQQKQIIIFDDFAKDYIKKGTKFIVEDKQEIAFLINKSNRKITDDQYFEIVLKMHPSYTINDINHIKYGCRTFTPAAYKSLLQKIIRFRASKITIEEYTYDSSFVLSTILVILLLHPGSFVPDIQRFVSGKESAFKRLVITLFEDSYVPYSYSNDIVSLTCYAYLCQRYKGWNPSIKSVKKLLRIADIAYNNICNLRWSIKSGISITPYVISNKIKDEPIKIVSAMIEELKSFNSDLAMIRDIANNLNSDTSDIVECIEEFEQSSDNNIRSTLVGSYSQRRCRYIIVSINIGLLK